MTAKKPDTEKEINSLKVVEVALPDAYGVPSEMSGKKPKLSSKESLDERMMNWNGVSEK